MASVIGSVRANVSHSARMLSVFSRMNFESLAMRSLPREGGNLQTVLLSCRYVEFMAFADNGICWD